MHMHTTYTTHSVIVYKHMYMRIHTYMYHTHHNSQELKALFYPFSQCEDYINIAYLKNELSKPIMMALRFVGDLSDEDFKDKEVHTLPLGLALREKGPTLR